MRIAVVGAGSWGTTLADLLARNGHDVRVWAREPEVVTAINERRENQLFLPGARLADRLEAHPTVAEVVREAELVVSAPPSHAVRDLAPVIATALARRRVPVVSVSKGLEPQSHHFLSDVLEAALPGCPIVALSGPTFAREVFEHQPSALVAASRHANAAAEAQAAFSNGYFRVYTAEDIVGVQLGGALKNVIALAAGILVGLDLGHNTQAALITRGLAEITRLGARLGADPLTFAGLAGLGDLVLTATGELSRNRSLGIELSRGRALKEILAERLSVAEGVNTARAAVELGEREGVELPIAREVQRILFEGKPPRQAVIDLMERALKPEQWQ